MTVDIAGSVRCVMGYWIVLSAGLQSIVLDLTFCVMKGRKIFNNAITFMDSALKSMHKVFD